ncbi:MAG: tryptophan--tRNA ligase [Candidatus Blackburnbacteria bacterium RIFCSPHIGHO2_02_FULL_39_13]|uniref:Tryptophan--tRNA ligase n=1 Tax=Candidatus Blackburnbacteria bacterium RIFCSPLOWO2_01_FULL_40_20 TaxID=1797519 RepID=A0A1G1VAN0_9BACT|nr:MAG: tryptophan--tRNA ligase [Candidatus Blackburnbacteria bacterium RIFCSPHIGHO2_01_FULL_40_17]OGY09909.1 MAG: tryptophan--tRNA ligase [Candidatus Blackburnbacteria bacterium RIFCSPHIGHO2_02_FULL_39_13]OGY12505.1 MAG: tryptophan--tRNA ligase [Candidatus Blackburnbacteria bacterium RIFCSPLOWO2_01_FULL_40_20]OGY15807.1 MAG: tryptophan--tRNA ligase [Candidatus Blackburnbacteria bacterium RIFCSPLOWO2_02_FULL_40_10]
MDKKRVLSGIRATGRLHLGNYLGAVKGMLELQKNPEYETFYMVADLHSITTPFDPEQLRRNIKEVVLDYLSAGLDPEKSTIFVQSHVREHTELAYLFSTVETVARMQHLPTFKEKVKQHPENVTMALLNYPILMAADILVYKAEAVPVGIDQEPHLEISREIARKMNEKYGLDFPEPQRFATKGESVPSLSGEGKMSKSVEGSYINLTDTQDEIKKKIRAVPTSSNVGGEMSPGVKTLFKLLELFAPEDVSKYSTDYKNGTLKFVVLKDYLSEAIFKELQPIQKKRQEIQADPEYVEKVLKMGQAKATNVASKVLSQTKKEMGLL